jgi:S-ribosylhomocysteine lyase LuxS involved in autoinducer biosynthesis
MKASANFIIEELELPLREDVSGFIRIIEFSPMAALTGSNIITIATIHHTHLCKNFVNIYSR